MTPQRDSDKDADLITQQAQELERLRSGQGISSAEIDLTKQLAASQARCRELERLAYLGDHHFPDLTWKARCEETAEDLRQLQATLAEREEWIRQLEVANKYFAISEENLAKERNAAVQEAGRLRSVLKKIAKPALGGKQQQWMAQEALKEPT